LLIPMDKKRLRYRLLLFWSLLLIPLVGNQFTTEIQWDMYDYLAAALLLGAGAWSIEGILQSRKSKHLKKIGVVLLILLLLILWAEMAVGLFESTLAGH